MTTGERRDDAWERLTPREREICKALAEGLTNPQIAVQLRLSHHTVRNHTHQVLRTLHMRTRSEVVAWYWRENPFA